MWIVVHIYYLIGFENRLLVIVQWAWSYLTLQRGARLITHESAIQPLRPFDSHAVAKSKDEEVVSAGAKQERSGEPQKGGVSYSRDEDAAHRGAT
jgi:NADH dehydrogenase